MACQRPMLTHHQLRGFRWCVCWLLPAGLRHLGHTPPPKGLSVRYCYSCTGMEAGTPPGRKERTCSASTSMSPSPGKRHADSHGGRRRRRGPGPARRSRTALRLLQIPRPGMSLPADRKRAGHFQHTKRNCETARERATGGRRAAGTIISYFIEQRAPTPASSRLTIQHRPQRTIRTREEW